MIVFVSVLVSGVVNDGIFAVITATRQLIPDYTYPAARLEIFVRVVADVAAIDAAAAAAADYMAMLLVFLLLKQQQQQQ